MAFPLMEWALQEPGAIPSGCASRAGASLGLATGPPAGNAIAAWRALECWGRAATVSYIWWLPGGWGVEVRPNGIGSPVEEGGAASDSPPVTEEVSLDALDSSRA
jgi:hypothetical protein